MLKTNSIATVGNRNKYGAKREPHRDGLGGVSNDLASAGDVVFGALIGRARLPKGLKSFAKIATFAWKFGSRSLFDRRAGSAACPHPRLGNVSV
jgi:hypothetical protein